MGTPRPTRPRMESSLGDPSHRHLPKGDTRAEQPHGSRDLNGGTADILRLHLPQGKSHDTLMVVTTTIELPSARGRALVPLGQHSGGC